MTYATTFDRKLSLFLISLGGEHRVYSFEWMIRTHTKEIERGMSCMRVYRNTDGTWSLMPNWFKTAEQNHKRSMSTTYNTFDAIPESIQEKLSVLLLQEPGSEWLTNIGKRVDDGVFWLEDG